MIESEVPENGWMTLDLEKVLTDLPRRPNPPAEVAKPKRKAAKARASLPKPARPASRAAPSRDEAPEAQPPAPRRRSSPDPMSALPSPLSARGEIPRQDRLDDVRPSVSETPEPPPAPAPEPRRRQIPESDIILISRIPAPAPEMTRGLPN